MQFCSSDEDEEEDPQIKEERKTLFDPYKKLVGRYFATSKAPGTISKYKGAMDRLQKWAEKWECATFLWNWTTV